MKNPERWRGEWEEERLTYGASWSRADGPDSAFISYLEEEGGWEKRIVAIQRDVLEYAAAVISAAKSRLPEEDHRTLDWIAGGVREMGENL